MEDQTEQHQKWWLKNKRLLISAIISIIAILIAFALAVHWFGWDWTGLSGFNGISVATDEATTPQKITKTIVYQVYQPGKTLWDWLQLLIIPAVLAVAGYVINLTISRGEQEATKQRANIEQRITTDNQREAALPAYIDKMSELLLHENLRKSSQGDEVRNIARVRTLTRLSQIGDELRTRSAILFLNESHLLDKGEPIIHLEGAVFGSVPFLTINLSGVNLSGTYFHETQFIGTNLSGANFSGAFFTSCSFFFANLQGANLSGAKFLEKTSLNRANLSGANLSGAILQGANLEKAELSNANLEEATIDGANLIGANLSNANLTNAFLAFDDLSGAEVTEELEKQAKSLKGATMPDGSIHP
jgi:uncharacterized protein YjbI with pentapeptide repeats